MLSSFVSGLMRRGSVSGSATSFAYNFCASAVYGVVLFGERLTPIYAGGFALILAGVMLMSKVDVVKDGMDTKGGGGVKAEKRD